MRWLIIVVLAFGIVGVAFHSERQIVNEQRAINAPPKPCVDEFWTDGLESNHGECAPPKRLRSLDNIGHSIACECPRPEPAPTRGEVLFDTVNGYRRIDR